MKTSILLLGVLFSWASLANDNRSFLGGSSVASNSSMEPFILCKAAQPKSALYNEAQKSITAGLVQIEIFLSDSGDSALLVETRSIKTSVEDETAYLVRSANLAQIKKDENLLVFTYTNELGTLKATALMFEAFRIDLLVQAEQENEMLFPCSRE